MNKDVVVYVLAIPEAGIWLKEVRLTPMSKRILFTDFFPDGAMEFGEKSMAEEFKRKNNLDTLEVEEHTYVNVPQTS